MSNSVRRVLYSIALLLSACSLEEHTPNTIVKGVVVNKVTEQPIAGMPITVIRYFSGMSGIKADSLTGTKTDAAGQYSLTFNTESAGYQVRLANQNEYFDLKNGYDSHVELERGIVNEYDFEVAPYKKVTVHGTATKNGKTSIDFDCTTTNRERVRYNCGTIFIDTIRAHQTISFTHIITVVPTLEYQFRKSTYNQNRRDYSSTVEARTIDYNDTTTVYLK